MSRIQRLLLLWAVLLLGACASSATPATQSSADESGVSDIPSAGTPIEPPIELSDFTFPSSDAGKPLSLSELRGKPVLVYFGYTFCPDACPTTLSEFSRVMRDLGDQADQVSVLMVSVDPERDTPDVLKRYLQAFDPRFVGMSGDHATLQKIGRQYGLYYERHQVDGSSAGYLVDHSTAAYLIDQQSRLRMVYSYGTPHSVITPDVQRLLAAGA